ncbi:MAG: cell division protein FtsQ/DivIB [Ruthenibacterium sp.]
MKVLFKLSNIEVRQPEEETTVYSDKQITAALGLEMGTQLFSIDLEQATQTLSTALPYLREVQVRRRLPATLVVSVQPAHETYAVAYEGGWAVVSEDLKVLRLSAEQPQGIAAVTGLEASAPAEGQPLQVAQADKLEALQTLQAQAQAAGLEQLTAIDMTNLSEVSAVYAGRVKITFGTMNDIEYKCSWAARLLLGEDDSAMIGEHETGTLDVSHRTQDGKGQAIWRAGAI